MHATSPDGPRPGLIVKQDSRPNGHWSLCLRRRRRAIFLSRAAGLTDSGAGLQEGTLSAGQTTIMDEVLAQGATRPATAEKRLVAVEPLLAHRTDPGLNPQQHRLPFPCGVSNTHGKKYSERASREARGVGRGVRWIGTLLLESGRIRWSSLVEMPDGRTGVTLRGFGGTTSENSPW